ncbi:MAG: hypothetical protein HY811_06885 [Planctomycetes bacterium]|nr:hypothetical protein [Planctomycetota bacterium]
MSTNDTDFTCPHCGTNLPANATSCKECGSDKSTGWAEDAADSGTDIPSQFTDADYDDFVKKEFGRPFLLNPWFIITTFIILLLIFLMIFYR